MNNSLNRFWFSIAGLLLFTLGTAVIYGWVAKLTLLTQLHSSFVPMQFNTALGFSLLGLAMLCVTRTPNLPVRLLAGTTALIGVATGLQYLLGISFGIDELLMKHYVTTQTSHPGRMAPNTALCFALSGCALLLLIQGRDNQWAYRTGIAGLLVFGLGVIAAGGYAAGMETSYGWGHLTRMALHTSVGFIIAGLALLVPAWNERNTLGLARVVPGFVGTVIALGAILMWTALESDRNSKVREWKAVESSGIANTIATALTRDILALERMADRMTNGIVKTKDEWGFDARSYLQDMDALDYLQVSVNGQILWDEPPHAEKRALSKDPPDGKFVIQHPIRLPEPRILTAMIDGRIFVEEALNHFVAVSEYHVRYDNHWIAHRERPSLEVRDKPLKVTTMVAGKPLEVEVVLVYRDTIKNFSSAALMALLVGLLSAFLASAWLYQTLSRG